MELKDEVIIVTGAGQGLGRQFALDCAANGMIVALADIDAEAMEKHVRIARTKESKHTATN